ncbi:hypothetical protein PIB30_086993 [Stylosanthes scabra]|uniref:Uncharacterized protein n=1 Tax=Stylosanthes scabra TaxID=79078 RepID=A0ABU6STJ7_9FABA|nr:hypothetical protein [Stylosanthes scabra]
MPNKGNKGGKPQVLLGRPFLKTTGFKLIYYDEIFTFEVGNAIEIFHLPPPPKPWNKGLHQLQHDKWKKIEDKPWKKAKDPTRKEKKPMIKPNHFKEKCKKGKKEDNKGSDPKKKKKKMNRSGTEEKEEEKLAEVESEKTTIKCSSFSGLMGKLKALKIILHQDKGADAHLMAPKGKAKIHRPPTRFSLQLAASRVHQPIDKAETSSRTPAILDPIVISSDSEEDLDPQGSSSEEEEP